MPHARVLRGWVRSTSGDQIAEGLSSIEDGIVEYRAAGAIVALPFSRSLKAEALHLAGRTSEALAAVRRRRRRWSKDLKRGYGLPNYSGCVVYFSRPLARTKPKLRLRFAQRSEYGRGAEVVFARARAETSYLEYRRDKEKGNVRIKLVKRH